MRRNIFRLHHGCAGRAVLHDSRQVPAATERFVMGGPPTADNICLRCAAHNRYESELFFGVNYPGIVRERHPEWPAPEFSSRNETG